MFLITKQALEINDHKQQSNVVQISQVLVAVS